MKICLNLTLLLMLFVGSSLKTVDPEPTPAQCYDPRFVEISTVTYNNERYSVVMMKREGNRIKAKYFAAPDYNGNNVYQRYTNWSNSVGNIVLVSSGTYMDHKQVPVGLTIDNGVPVNETLINNRMDGLTIVFATGGIAVSNLKDGDLSLSGGGVDPNRKFNLRGSATDLEDFMDWAKSQEATVFQTHLLAYRNKLTFTAEQSVPTPRERRFLAVGKDEDGNIVHVIVNSPQNASLYESSKKTLNFLNNFKDIEVVFMINLDTGAQDVFELRNSDCSRNSSIKGTQQLNTAANLLSYYFQ